MNSLPSVLFSVGYLFGGHYVGSIMAGIACAGGYCTLSKKLKDATIYPLVVGTPVALVGFTVGEVITLIVQGTLVGVNWPVILGGVGLTHLLSSYVLTVGEFHMPRYCGC